MNLKQTVVTGLIAAVVMAMAVYLLAQSVRAMVR